MSVRQAFSVRAPLVKGHQSHQAQQPLSAVVAAKLWAMVNDTPTAIRAPLCSSALSGGSGATLK
jgi:hypothetical protein